MTEEKKFLERPLAVIGLVGGGLGVIATGIGIYTSLAGARPAVGSRIHIATLPRAPPAARTRPSRPPSGRTPC